MGSDLQYVAVYGTDIIGSADSRIPGAILNERKRMFWQIFRDCQGLKRLEHDDKIIEIKDAGDGFFIVVNIDQVERLVQLTMEIKKRLDEYNLSQKDTRSHIKIRNGINVGSIYKDGITNKVYGSAIDYTERILSIGQADHILLTHSALTTILALDNKYEENFRYCGKYPIKHGEYLDVFLFRGDHAGEPKPPRRSIKPIIFYMSKINQVLGIVLLSFSITALFINGYTYTENLGRNEELNMMGYQEKENVIRTTIGDKVKQIRIYEDNYREVIKDELTTNMESLHNMESLNAASKTNASKSLLGLLKASSLTITKVNSDIDYVIIASMTDGKCDAKIYEPFGYRTIVKDWSNQPWCKNSQNDDYYLSHTYFSSGANTFINTLRSTIRVGGVEQHTEGYLLFAIDWNNILTENINNSLIENLDLILVDNRNNIAAMCYYDRPVCDDFAERIQTDLLQSTPKSFVLNDFEKQGYEIREIELPSARELDFGSRSQVLDGWKIYMRYPIEQTMSEIENTGNTIVLGINLAIVALLVYYYLTPRFGLRELTNDRPVIPASIK